MKDFILFDDRRSKLSEVVCEFMQQCICWESLYIQKCFAEQVSNTDNESCKTQNFSSSECGLIESEECMCNSTECGDVLKVNEHFAIDLSEEV
ncbi:hypothetical protein MACJ_003829 [Theileria orientalis]|uniref:Uncharacterized protein n=1 Tax=Theileria orientalis TaxID=68886 RepID=A0A976XJV9_THEOR|nr:hypothetical protein MACJ_003829 [Theileria orientalis]